MLLFHHEKVTKKRKEYDQDPLTEKKNPGYFRVKRSKKFDHETKQNKTNETKQNEEKTRKD